MGKHSGSENPDEAALQAKADEFDQAQAAIDAQVAEYQTDYPAIQNYENKQKS